MQSLSFRRLCLAAIHDLLTLRVNLVLLGVAALASPVCAMVFVAVDPSAASSTDGANAQAAQLIGAVGLMAGLVAATISSATVAADASHGVTRTRSIAEPRAARRFAATMLGAAIVATGSAATCILAAVGASWPVLAHFSGEWAPGPFLLYSSGVALTIGLAGGLIGASIGVMSEGGQAATVATMSLLVAAPFVFLVSSLPQVAASLPAGLAVSAISHGASGIALLGLLAWVCSALLAAAAAPALVGRMRRQPRAIKRLAAKSSRARSRSTHLSAVRIGIAAVFEVMGSGAFRTAIIIAPLFVLGAASAAASGSQPPDADGGSMRLDTYALAAGQPVAQLMVALTICVVVAGSINGPVARSIAIAVAPRPARALSLIVTPAIVAGAVTMVAMMAAVPSVTLILDYNGVLPEQRDGGLLLTGFRQAVATALTAALATAFTILFRSAAFAGTLLIVFVTVAPTALGTLSFILAPAGQPRTLWLDALADLLPGQLSHWASQIPPTVEVSQLGVAIFWLAVFSIASLVAHTRRDLA